MAIATLQEAVSTLSSPPYTIARWSCPTDSTSLIEISLPALTADESSYKREPRNIISGTAYAIRLLVFGVSCDSTDFDIQVLTRDDETLVDTIYEVMNYSNLNLNNLDQSFNHFIIKNCDTTMTNKLYMLFTDNSGAGGGTLNIQLSYMCLQDRQFANILHN